MSDFRVRLDPSYPFRLREDWRELWRALEDDHGDRDWILVFDRRVLRAQPGALKALRVGRRRAVIARSGGERIKSLAAFASLHEQIHRHAPDRDTLLVAVGGGTIGDLVGFVAATHLRGLDWCPVATTTLAMIDSALGGKTAVDLRGRKNLVGAFHQPRGVYGVIESLDTLPLRHFRAGLAEMVKAAMIADAPLFARLEREAAGLRAGELEGLAPLLARAARIKARIVAVDEREQGSRALLNFGHTLGHALEAVADGRWLHGEAVGLGMIAATQLSVARGLAQVDTLQRLQSLLRELGLPITASGLDLPSLWQALSYDKKRRRSQVRGVLTHGIGSASFGHPLRRPEIDRALRSISPQRSGAARR